MTFYVFARTMDDIADSPDLSPSEKTDRLEMFADIVAGGIQRPGYEAASAMAQSLSETGGNVQHCLDLAAAFCQDARQDRYDDWTALMAYCRLSAAPVGRYLLDLHGGGVDGYGPSDALCCALQVINHLQDCGDDYRTLNRVYLPGDWMDREGADVAMLGDSQISVQLRRVLDRALTSTEELLRESRGLPGGLSSRRLGMEAAVIQRIAEALVVKLYQQDPLARQVSLGRVQVGVCGVLGVFSGVFSARRA